jgi:hypothetical protein
VAPLVSWLKDKSKGSIYFLTFPDSLPIPYTTSNLVTYLEVVLGSSTHHHKDGDIPNTGIRLVLLDHGSIVDERDPSIFKTFPVSFPMNYTTSNLATYLEVVLGSSKYHHQDGDIPNTGSRMVFLDHGSMVDESDPSIFKTFPVCLPMKHTTLRLGLPRRGIRKYKISSPG